MLQASDSLPVSWSIRRYYNPNNKNKSPLTFVIKQVPYIFVFNPLKRFYRHVFVSFYSTLLNQFSHQTSCFSKVQIILFLLSSLFLGHTIHRKSVTNWKNNICYLLKNEGHPGVILGQDVSGLNSQNRKKKKKDKGQYKICLLHHFQCYMLSFFEKQKKLQVLLLTFNIYLFFP